MNVIPTIPGWNGIHPVLVQFAVVLLFAAPLLLVIALFSRHGWRSWNGAGLLLMALGTVATWLAVASGHAAGQLVDMSPAMAAAIAHHESLGLLTRTVFTTLTLAFAALMLLQGTRKKALPVAGRLAVHAVFVVAYLACTLAVANTADRGGRLVHEFGVRAMVAQEVAPPAQPAGVADRR